MLSVVVLMMRLGWKKLACDHPGLALPIGLRDFNDLGHHRAGSRMLPCVLLAGKRNGGSLLGAKGKDNLPILRAHIVALTIRRGGVMDEKKEIEEILVANEGGIKGDPHHIGMPRAS